MRLYYESMGPHMRESAIYRGPVNVPTAVANFPCELYRYCSFCPPAFIQLLILLI